MTRVTEVRRSRAIGRPASSSRIMSTVEGSRWTRADLKIVHENLASASDKSTQKSRSTYDLPRIMMRHSNSLPFPSEFKANFSTRPPLDCDKSMEQNPKPQACENWEGKSADNSAIRAEFAGAESCMILKLCMIDSNS